MDSDIVTRISGRYQDPEKKKLIKSLKQKGLGFTFNPEFTDSGNTDPKKSRRLRVWYFRGVEKERLLCDIEGENDSTLRYLAEKEWENRRPKEAA